MKLPWISRVRHKKEMKQQRLELLGFCLTITDEELKSVPGIEDWLEDCEIRIMKEIQKEEKK